MSIRTLYLIRHAQFHHDPQAASSGTLTPLGRRQARRLRGALRDHPIRSIYTSTLTRARETGAIVASGFNRIEVRAFDMLRECFPELPIQGPKQWQPDLEPETLPYRMRSNRRFGERLESKAALKVQQPVESLNHGRCQMDEAFRTFFKPAQGEDRHELLVCHGNVIRALFCRALGVPAKYWLSMTPNHCGVTRIEIKESRRIRVLSLNECGHLPPELRTKL